MPIPGQKKSSSSEILDVFRYTDLCDQRELMEDRQGSDVLDVFRHTDPGRAGRGVHAMIRSLVAGGPVPLLGTTRRRFAGLRD